MAYQLKSLMPGTPGARVIRPPIWAAAMLMGGALVAAVDCESNEPSGAGAGAAGAAGAAGPAGAAGAAGEAGSAGAGGATTLPPCEVNGGPESLVGCVEPARYVGDVTFIAAERTPGSAHWQKVQDLCAGRLTELGYEVELQVYGTGVNVVGVRRGTGAPNEAVLVSAHYDHIEGCAGADDNATGVAAVLEAARVIALRPPSARTLVAACWDEEERRGDASVVGSAAYAQRARERGDAIVANFVLDGIGFASSEPNSQELPEAFNTAFGPQVAQVRDNQRRGDFIAVILDSGSHGPIEQFITYASSVSLPVVAFEVPTERVTEPQLGDLRRSDHASFWDSMYPGALLTDTANFRNPRYHCEGGPDTVDSLDHGFATRVVRATTATAARVLAGP